MIKHLTFGKMNYLKNYQISGNQCQNLEAEGDKEKKIVLYLISIKDSQRLNNIHIMCVLDGI